MEVVILLLDILLNLALEMILMLMVFMQLVIH